MSLINQEFSVIEEIVRQKKENKLNRVEFEY